MIENEEGVVEEKEEDQEEKKEEEEKEEDNKEEEEQTQKSCNILVQNLYIKNFFTHIMCCCLALTSLLNFSQN